jgi:hypothetical protein
MQSILWAALTAFGVLGERPGHGLIAEATKRYPGPSRVGTHVAFELRRTRRSCGLILFGEMVHALGGRSSDGVWGLVTKED